MVLLILGIVLLMPPIAGIFDLDAKIFGVPATLLYLFSVWLALIVGTARLSVALSKTDASSDDRA